MEDIGILSALFAIIGTIVGGWVKLNVKISSQKVEHDNLEREVTRLETEINELKKSRSKIEDKLFQKLEDLSNKLNDFMMRVEARLK